MDPRRKVSKASKANQPVWIEVANLKVLYMKSERQASLLRISTPGVQVVNIPFGEAWYHQSSHRLSHHAHPGGCLSGNTEAQRWVTLSHTAFSRLGRRCGVGLMIKSEVEASKSVTRQGPCVCV